MNILVIGTGMYVTGRNNSGVGTIMSSIAELSKSKHINSVSLVSKSASSSAEVLEAKTRINSLLGTNVDFQFFALESDATIAHLHEKINFDAVIISVPDHLHFYFGKICLELKIPVLMVKPLTPTLEEAQELIKIQKENNVYAAVEFHKRWDETNLYSQKIIQQNVLGDLLYATVDYSQKVSIPLVTFKAWAAETNIFQYLGVHYADLMYFLTGYLPKRLNAYGTKSLLQSKGIDTYDSVHATIIWENKEGKEFYSHYNINWVDPVCTSAMSDQKFMIVGTKGRVECDQKKRGLEVVTSEIGIQHHNPYFSDYLPEGNGKYTLNGYGHKSISQFFLDVENLQNNKVTIEELEQYRPTFSSALVSTQIVDAVNKSLVQNNQWINI
jgi:predicted dehydrogenase